MEEDRTVHADLSLLSLMYFSIIFDSCLQRHDYVSMRVNKEKWWGFIQKAGKYKHRCIKCLLLVISVPYFLKNTYEDNCLESFGTVASIFEFLWFISLGQACAHSLIMCEGNI